MIKYYFLSQNKNLDCVLYPRIPDNRLTRQGYEDNKIKRVCVATSISGALKGLSIRQKDAVYYVYRPIGEYNILKPSVQQVPDVEHTGERWILTPVKMELIKSIQITEPSEYFVYKIGNVKHKAHGWKYKTLENLQISNESILYKWIG